MGNQNNTQHQGRDLEKYQSAIRDKKRETKKQSGLPSLIFCSSSTNNDFDSQTNCFPQNKQTDQDSSNLSRVREQKNGVMLWMVYFIEQCSHQKIKGYSWASQLTNKFSSQERDIKLQSHQQLELKQLKIALNDISGFDLTSSKLAKDQFYQSSFLNEIRESKILQEDKNLKKMGLSSGVFNTYNIDKSSNITFRSSNIQRDIFQNGNSIQSGELYNFQGIVEDTIIFEEEIQNAIFKRKNLNNKYQNQQNLQNNNLYSNYQFNTSQIQNDNVGIYAKDFELGISMLSFYKRLIEILQFQLQNKENALRFLLKHFKKTILQNYSTFITDYQEDRINLKTLQSHFNNLKEEMTSFTKIFLNTFMYYYHLEEFQNKAIGGLLTRENFWNFIITILFDQKIYSLIYAYYKIIDEEENKIFIKQIICLQNKQPQDLDVRPLYCLNQLTIDFINEKYGSLQGRPTFEYDMNIQPSYEEDKFYNKNITINSSMAVNSLNINISDDLQSTQSQNLQNDQKEEDIITELNKVENESSKRIIDHEEYKNIDEKTLNSEIYNGSQSMIKNNKNNNTVNYQSYPYEQAIEHLKNIIYVKSPVHKLKIITKVISMLNQHIQDFYKMNKITIQTILESDDLMSIVVYITAKSQLQNLSAHLKLTEDFLTSQINNSRAGYHLTNFLAAIKFIQELNISQLNQQKQPVLKI